MKKSSRYGIAALVIVAIICVMFCMPLGILIGKSIYDKPDNSQVNNNVSNNSEETNTAKEDILYYDINEVEKLDKDSRFVQELYDCISYESATGLFMTSELSIDLNEGKIVGASLNEISDESLFRFAVNRVSGSVVSEDEYGGRTIQYKENELRDKIAFVFGKNRSSNIDFSSLITTGGTLGYGQTAIKDVDNNTGIITTIKAPDGGAYVKTFNDAKIIRALKNVKTGDVYIYESIVQYAELDNTVMGVYNAKFIYTEEDGVYYFNGIQVHEVF